ncbi:hypothetical protein HAX54_041725 [Datura stramonium]|uniref:Uncharacterized protein n=1 Tax=Datura stramonium TaxID=4076 RepID=A0ABS8VZS1_DATST|nr:hypothetical protein [Datura stramonium]
MRKRLADAEQRIANILKPYERISGFDHNTRRLANNIRQLTRKGKDKMETNLSGESIGLSPNMSIVNHGSSIKKKTLAETVVGIGLQAQTREGNLQGTAKRPISLKVFLHQSVLRWFLAPTFTRLCMLGEFYTLYMRDPLNVFLQIPPRYVPIMRANLITPQMNV